MKNVSEKERRRGEGRERMELMVSECLSYSKALFTSLLM
jgi:hypothetical protein